MATRKINFRRFKEGDPFSTEEIDNRFSQFEKDLNETEDGLHQVSIGEGALNYHHLASPGSSTTTDYNFGSTLVNATSLRNDPAQLAGAWQEYNGYLHPELWTHGHDGARWSLNHGEVIGHSKFGSTTGFHPKKMEMSITDVKMGSDYYDSNDPGYSSGILLMFNTYVMSHSRGIRDGFGIELQVKCNTGTSTAYEWVPISGSDRWLYYNSVTTGGTDASVQMGQTVSIRLFLSRQRILDCFGFWYNPDVTSANMVVKGFRAKIGFSGNQSATGGTPSDSWYEYPVVYLKESTLSVLALRAKRAT